jgi:hypothetical protein
MFPWFTSKYQRIWDIRKNQAEIYSQQTELSLRIIKGDNLYEFQMISFTVLCSNVIFLTRVNN